MWAIAGVLLAVGALVVGFVVLLFVAFVRRPANHPRAFLQRGRRPTTATLVVCAGDSTTHASLSADYVAALRARFGGQSYEFVNAGVNGSTSHDLLRRLDDIVACQPDAVTLLIGTNDTGATPTGRTTPEAFGANLAAILARLRVETGARLAVLSVPPLGEDPDSETNRGVASYNAAIAAVAAAHGATYLPLHETLLSLITANSQRRPRPFRLRVGLLVGNAVRRYVGRQDWDAIAARHGFLVLTDQIHLSDRGATVVANLIADWLAPPAATTQLSRTEPFFTIERSQHDQRNISV